MATQTDCERTTLQFEYAWRWFESSAKQRMTMFYYYLIMVGILTNAWVLAYDKRLLAVTVAISLLGIVTSVAAICFDVRNRRMAKAGEDILERLELEAIYNGNGSQIGPLSIDRRAGMREGQKRSIGKRLLKHKFWIRSLEGLFALGFALSIVLATAEAKELAENGKSQSFAVSIAEAVHYPPSMEKGTREAANGN